MTCSFGISSSHFHEISRHTSKFGFVSYEAAISISSFQRILFEAHRSEAEFFRELFVSLFVFSREVSTVVGKTFESVFEQHRFFGVEVESFANFIYSLNAFEELFVEVDFVRVSFDERHYFQHDLSHFVVRFSAIESEEYRGNVVEERTRTFERNDSVFECWSFSVVDDSFDFGFVFSHSTIKSRFEVLVFQLVETESSVRSSRFNEEWVLLCLFTTHCECQD